MKLYKIATCGLSLVIAWLNFSIDIDDTKRKLDCSVIEKGNSKNYKLCVKKKGLRKRKIKFV